MKRPYYLLPQVVVLKEAALYLPHAFKCPRCGREPRPSCESVVVTCQVCGAKYVRIP